MNDKYWCFHSLLAPIIEEHAPLKTKRVRPKQPPFMNSKLRKSVNRKAQLRNKFNKYPTRKNWEKYRRQRNITTHIRRESIRNYLIENCSGKANKTFYNTIRPLVNSKPIALQPTQLLEDDTLVQDEEQIANIMNTYFTNIAENIGD